MRWLSDDAVSRLRSVADTPDFSGTRYRIVGEIARGGMGVVYEADDLALDRRVAVKVIASELADEESIARMRREARIVARLEHPGIVPVHDVGVLPDGRIYYAMKLVRGLRLDRWAEGHALTERLRVFIRICEPVAFAHANGVIHRDLKPENVMVGEFGAVLVMDWGVARAMHETENERVIAGTRGFMPPEQECGDASAIDARSDVFALGAMLRELIGDAPRSLAAIANKATAHQKEHRYPDARELGADVVRWLDGDPVSAYRENAIERAARWLSKNKAIVGMIVAYLVMRAIVFLWARL